MLQVIEAIRVGQIDTERGVAILTSAFPIDESTAKKIIIGDAA